MSSVPLGLLEATDWFHGAVTVTVIRAVNVPPPCGRMTIDGLPTVGTWQLLNPPHPDPVWMMSVVEHMPTVSGVPGQELQLASRRVLDNSRSATRVWRKEKRRAATRTSCQ